MKEPYLELSRTKRGGLLLFFYRCIRLLGIIFGNKRILKIVLSLYWVLKRAGYGLSSLVNTMTFQNEVQALNFDFLNSKIKSTDVIVDFACGTGRHFELIGEKCKKYIGIDRDETHIKNNKERQPSATWITGSIEQLYQLENPDGVILSNILEHLDDPGELLQALKQKTSYLLIEVPDFECDPLNISAANNGVRWYTDADHVREYTTRSLNKLLFDSGWDNMETVQRNGSIGSYAINRSL